MNKAEKAKAYREELKAEGYCPRCYKRKAVAGKLHCKECEKYYYAYYHAHKAQRLEYAKQRREKLKAAGLCTQCGKRQQEKGLLSMGVEKINNVTIEHTPTNKYFAVLNVKFEPQPMSNKGGKIGIDVGIKEFYSDSNGNVVCNPKYLEKSMRKLIREQRKLSRKEKGSTNRNKQRVKVALVHEKITNQRNDFLQKQSTMLIRENQTICIEDLKVKNMMRNHKLAQHIGSASWSKFFDMLSYKSVWYGNDIVKVPTMYPSSQACSCCGFKNPLVKNLAIRKWECPECHTKHDRDTNASINILNKGLQMQSA
jgi:putative transposase